MKAEIICVGEELLSGDTLNTNSKYISRKLSDLGILVRYQTTIGDDFDDIKEATLQGIKRSDLIIYTGGLGPTKDDLTKETVSEALGLELQLKDDIVSKIKDRFKRIGVTMTSNNLKQAYIPKGSIELVNNHGTAPGIALEYECTSIVLLPGPPKEMKPMFEEYIINHLSSKSDYIIESKTIKTMGIGESKLETKIEDIIEDENDVNIATYAGNGQVKVKLTCISKDKKSATKLIEDVINKIDERIGEYIYSYDGESIEDVVYKLLLEHDMMVGFCESCTGGLISSRMTKLSGVSAVFDRGIVTYSNNAKMEELNVKSETLEKYGAVSKETALEMAKGLLERENIDIALSVTGIAGPTGGTKEKPVGLVYIGLATKKYSQVWKFNFIGDRSSVQNRTANTVFNLTRKYILEQK